MDNLEYLDKTVEIKIDRPMGSKHPEHGFIYPLNYGYIPNTVSGDGEEVDAYILGVYERLENFTGKCIAIIHRSNDNDDKLIIVPENKVFNNSEIRALTDFQEQYFKSIIIRPDNYINWNKNIPELRFPEIEGEWKKITLNNLAKIQRGASPRPISSNRWYDNENKKVGWVRIGDVTNSSRYLYRWTIFKNNFKIKRQNNM